MAKSTPQTKPNLFGTLTQKPVKEAKKDTKDLNQPSVSSTKANKSVVSREIVEEKPNTDTKSNVVVTTMSEQSDHSNSVVTATETLSKRPHGYIHPQLFRLPRTIPPVPHTADYEAAYSDST